MEEKESIELNLGEFSRDQLEYMIQQSCELDVPVSQVIADILKNFLESPNEK